jgi:hypothetical protein
VIADYRRMQQRGYYEDLFAIHEALELGREFDGVRVMANLTPIKEKECIVVASAFDDAFVRHVYAVLNCLTDQLNVVSFNLAIWQPPMSDSGEDWSDFPIIARIVERGDPLNRTADFGAMELYAASVVSSDPFKVADALWRTIDAS